MDAVVKFHLPDPMERWRLWQVHLPAGHMVESTALEEIALRYELTGGQIRNVCVNAALAMLSGVNTVLALPQLKSALQAEHRKAGSSFIDSVSASRPGRQRAMATFLGGLS
jgi:ATP-dependent 26S proteasome regulatory subunit